MPRPTPENEIAGSDSFLSIASNIVGIMIILVMVAGARAKQLPAVAESDPNAPHELELVHRSAELLEADVNGLAAQSDVIKREAAERFDERGRLALLVAAADKELAARRAALDAQSRDEYDLERALALARLDLDKLVNQRALSAAASEQVAEKIENFPTPISKTVDGKEAHFQIKGGRIVPIPLEDLLKKFKSIVREKAWKLSDLPEITDTLGPLGGFNLRYTLERVDISPEKAMEIGHGGSMIQLSKWELIPVSGQLGETLEVALSAKSLFRATLDTTNPRDWTITLWVYPDSFTEFRRIKKELYLLGYATAARPLPADSPIGGSPKGSKSAAE
jgi:hypothetical protein